MYILYNSPNTEACRFQLSFLEGNRAAREAALREEGQY